MAVHQTMRSQPRITSLSDSDSSSASPLCVQSPIASIQLPLARWAPAARRQGISTNICAPALDVKGHLVLIRKFCTKVQYATQSTVRHPVYGHVTPLWVRQFPPVPLA